MTKVTMTNVGGFLGRCQSVLSNLHSRPLLISIDGRHASGKSLASAFIKGYLLQLSIPSTIVHGDHFFVYADKYATLCRKMEFKPIKESFIYNYDLASLERFVVSPLRISKPSLLRDNKWIPHVLDGHRSNLRPKCAVIVEGFASQHRKLREMFDINIYMDTDLDTCVRLSTDRHGGGPARRYEKMWRAAEKEYFANESPERFVDFKIHNNVEDGRLEMSEYLTR